ncbi:MAG: hypothetical protein ACKO38_07810 [Planctomycetota bacterium]
MSRAIRAILLSGLTLLVSSLAGTAEAGHRHCPPYYVGGVCAPCVVERTVMVPQTVMEQRTVHVTQYRCEPRHQVVAYTRMVPEVHSYKKPVTVMTQVARQRTVPYTVMKPVCREVEYEVVVNVPHVEVRQGVRMCTQYMPTTEHRVIHEDRGHYEERIVETPVCEPVYSYGCGPRWLHRRCGWRCDPYCDPYCGPGACVDGCAVAPCQVVHRVWVPEVVERTIDVVVHRPVCVEEKFEYQVVVCRPERRIHKKLVTEYVPVMAERVETYFECVPEVREVVYHQTVCKPVVEHRTVTRMVTVPYVVEKVVCVPVCRMVPRRVVCSAPVCGPVYGPACGPTWGPNWWCYP